MTFSTKLSISVIATFAVVGMLAFTTPTHAGFFDWLTGSNQTAQISKAVDSRTTATMSASTEVEVKPTFWQRLFGIRTNTNKSSLSVQGETSILSCDPNATPSISLVTPHSGVHEAGDALSVEWESCNIPSTVQIFVQLRNAQTNASNNLISAEGNSNPNDGSTIVTIPVNTGTGYYKVRIGYSELSHEGALYDDMSDDTLEITGESNPVTGSTTSPSTGSEGSTTSPSTGSEGSTTSPSAGSEGTSPSTISGTPLSGSGSTNLSVNPNTCNESDVEVSITGNTPSGIQSITQFDVLEFTIENNSNCDILFEDMKVAYMTTDGKPYFDEIQVRGENGAFLGENDELSIDPNFHLGDRITIDMNGVEGFEIDAGDHVDLTLRLMNYDQPVFDNTVPYNSYIHKYLMFGFVDEDDFDFKWGAVNNSPSFGATYTNNDLWGKRVRIPVSSLGL